MCTSVVIVCIAHVFESVNRIKKTNILITPILYVRLCDQFCSYTSYTSQSILLRVYHRENSTAVVWAGVTSMLSNSAESHRLEFRWSILLNKLKTSQHLPEKSMEDPDSVSEGSDKSELNSILESATQNNQPPPNCPARAMTTRKYESNRRFVECILHLWGVLSCRSRRLTTIDKRCLHFINIKCAKFCISL